MLRRRARLPVLAEISGPPEGDGPWALRRSSFESLEASLPALTARPVLLVTGERGEIATAATAVAAAASASGRRALMLECDIAEPSLASRLGLEAAPGLHEYLRWEAEPGDVLQPLALAGSAVSGQEPLVCICAGRPAGEAETLLGLQSFAHMIAKLRAAYELVVIAAPPAESEPGSCAAVAHQADAALAAVPAVAGKGKVGRSARAAIRRLSAPALGAITVRPR
jgi:Mrp family chromosome partitioning ATPase